MASNELYLYGSVGMDWWGEECFTAAEVRDDLAERSGPLTVRINSGGGIASEGQAIYTLLCDYPEKVTVIIDGVAASSASLIAMAGEEIIMRLGSYMLIHDPACPYTDGRGTEEDHLRLAKQLNVTSGAYADIYALRAGITRDEARAVMREETFLDGPAAVEAGFATAYDGTVQSAVAAKFDYRIYAKAPRALRDASEGLGRVPAKEAVMAMMAGQSRNPKKRTMTMAKDATDAAVVDSTVVEAPVTTATDEPAALEVATLEAAAIMAAATKAERERSSRIQAAVTMAKLPQVLATQLITEGVALDKALDTITANWKKEGDVDLPMQGREPAKVGMEARDKFIMGASAALMLKAGIKGGERNEFTSLSLSELARESIVMAGGNGRFADRREMVGHAFTMAGAHTTSDFANILANIMGKSALQGWAEAPETFDTWTRKGTLSDFKATKRVGVGLMTALPALTEGEDYQYGTVGDRGEAITLATYGKMIRLSRQAIINDDLSLLGSVPMKMGRAARATVGNLVYAVLTANPTMSDGVALFHANHGNLTGTGTVISVTSIGTARALMRVQKEATGGQPLNIIPKYLLVPAALEIVAKQTILSSVDPTANKGHAINPVNNSAEVIVDARLDAASATAWYMAADGQGFDTIEVAYLDGNDAPYLEQQTAWTSDGVEMKVRIDAGVAPLDYRTLYKNVGA